MAYNKMFRYWFWQPPGGARVTRPKPTSRRLDVGLTAKVEQMVDVHKKFFFPVLAARWGKRAAHNRAQIVFYLAENLELRRDEFAKRLSAMTGCSGAEALHEVDLSINRLFHWGAYADKYGGTVQVSCFKFKHPAYRLG